MGLDSYLYLHLFVSPNMSRVFIEV